MSRLHLASDAVRPAMFGRLLLAGPSGGGKTWTGLTIARALAGDKKILCIDTEEESALTYADSFDFTHIPWREPYNPLELAETMIDAGKSGFGAIMVDSATHFWFGPGGILDIADGKFGGWKTARPTQRDMVLGILRTQAHVVLCVRSKMAHEQVLQANGKYQVQKLGMAPMQDSDLEYELNVSAEVDMEHRLTIGKTRCAALAGRTFNAHHQAEMAEVYGEWLKGGAPVELAEPTQVDALVARMNALTDDGERKAAKAEFKRLFGLPKDLRASQVVEADALVARYESANYGAEADAVAPGPEVESANPTPEDAKHSTEEGGDGVEEGTPRLTPVGGGKVTGQQMRKLFALLAGLGIADEDRHDYVGQLLDRNIESFSDLTKADAIDLIDQMESDQAAAS